MDVRQRRPAYDYNFVFWAARGDDGDGCGDYGAIVDLIVEMMVMVADGCGDYDYCSGAESGSIHDIVLYSSAPTFR